MSLCNVHTHTHTHTHTHIYIYGHISICPCLPCREIHEAPCAAAQGFHLLPPCHRQLTSSGAKSSQRMCVCVCVCVCECARVCAPLTPKPCGSWKTSRRSCLWRVPLSQRGLWRE
ncbi:hypothetical protein LZ31DRAFT_313846 [Colletotrichum somersetense]|nr:hypothetical protein LZ31DRAFT_313846 [Colletotrichum somersetense]